MTNHQLIGLLVAITIGSLVSAFDEKQLGYYAFEKAGRNDLPPRVRPPPYLQSNIPCPNSFLSENKDTLCGDLKRGYVPLNPMNVVIQNQHYPFELIKNKTLHFLAKTLPYLKEDHENIPKVFKIPQTASNNLNGYNELYSNMDPNAMAASNYRVKRQAKATVTKIEKSELNLNETSSKNPQNMSTVSKKYKGMDNNETPMQESRQKGCDQNDGILCHVMQVLTSNSKSSSDGSLFNTISQTYQTYKTAKDLSNFVQMISGSLDKSDNGAAGNEKTGNYQYSNRPTMSQLLSAFSAIGNQQATTTNAPVANNNQDNNFNNPLGAILNYLSSSNTGSSLLNRKKKPSEMEEYINGLTAASSQISPTVAMKTTPEEQAQVAQPTPTACPSIEEYVTPVYARNYQGVWKYVVQIPHEGYFTQTIQKTSCVKNKCDFMDGQCKEASRWVSLLVAEVYYPNAKQPLSNILPQASQMKPAIYNELNSKLNGQPATAFASASPNAADQNLLNYDLYNNLMPTNYNEYSFARRASKHHQPVNQVTNQAANTKIAYPIAASAATPTASYALPQQQYPADQYQEFNANSNQPQYQQPNLNYNQFNQLINNAQYQQPIKQQSAVNQPSALSQAQAKAQLQQLIDLYQQQITRQQQQQYLQQLAKSAKSYNSGAYSNMMMIDNLAAASMMQYPTVVSQSSNQQQQMHQPTQAQQLNGKLDSKQNEVKPRSFDSVNSQNILESTLMKSSYINNNHHHGDDSMNAAASSNSDKMMVSNEANANSNQPTDLNNSNTNPSGDQTENTSKENTEECDGYDNNGCYVIRVYYDWFLVSGSCKCWKTNKGGSFEALKKMFIGK